MILHPNSPNAKMAAARAKVAAMLCDDATVIDTSSGVTVADVRYLARITICLDLGDTDPATWPAQNIG